MQWADLDTWSNVGCEKCYKALISTICAMFNQSKELWNTMDPSERNNNQMLKLYTEPGIKACTWLREISSCYCLIILPGPACLLLNKICIPLFRALYVMDYKLGLWELVPFNAKEGVAVHSREKVLVRGCKKFLPCSCLTFLPGPAWVLLSKICKDFFSAL